MSTELTTPVKIEIPGIGTIESADLYLKSEADKVIAGLQDKLQKESALLKETREWLIESQKLHKRCADNAVKMIRHSKYKRCLDKAKWCEDRVERELERLYPTKVIFYENWKQRWLELAEKFKES